MAIPICICACPPKTSGSDRWLGRRVRGRSHHREAKRRGRTALVTAWTVIIPRSSAWKDGSEKLHTSQSNYGNWRKWWWIIKLAGQVPTHTYVPYFQFRSSKKFPKQDSEWWVLRFHSNPLRRQKSDLCHCFHRITYIYMYMYYRRKFRSQTSDNNVGSWLVPRVAIVANFSKLFWNSCIVWRVRFCGKTKLGEPFFLQKKL